MNTHTQTLWQPPKGYAISPVKVTTDCVHCVCASVCNMTFTPFLCEVRTKNVRCDRRLKPAAENLFVWFINVPHSLSSDE